MASALSISDELAQTIQREANTRGMLVEEFLRAVILREQTLSDRQQITQEQAWWQNLPLRERAQYEGKFIAVYHRTLVDSDSDDQALYRRVRARYGNAPVLIMPAEGPREIRVYSPRVMPE